MSSAYCDNNERLQLDSLSGSQVLTNPGLIAKKTNSFSLTSAAYFAFVIFAADFAVESGLPTSASYFASKSTSPAKLDGHDLLCATLLKEEEEGVNYWWVRLIGASKEEKEDKLTNSLNSSIRTSSLPMLRGWNPEMHRAWLSTQYLLANRTCFKKSKPVL